ncbi:LADA_0E06238g1_1 [Lachancea dasiensis]|uniref:LADA_0E06238g1_1 n=1 Tax=Lachancea dasiensis TaxID=1072105 RepID=A0A1G4JCD8_9SACH|nr:LADA_0E06238g1_1 [Lachancea dasiensis]
MSRLNMVCDTRDTFYGRNVFETWKKEQRWWIHETSQLDYQFPELEPSRFEEGLQCGTVTNGINCAEPTICLNLCWSRDGTSLVAVFNDYGVRQYLVPEISGSPLIPFKRFFRPQSIVESCVHPLYSIFDGDKGVNVMLSSSKELPLQLFSLSPHASEHAPLYSYSVANVENERFETMYSLSFHQESAFLAGSSRNKIFAYDLNRKHPVWSSTRDNLKMRRRPAHRSIVSCFDEIIDLEHKPMRFAATYNNDVLGVDLRCQKLALLASGEDLGIKSGSGGIVQLLFSVNKHFMYVIKRNSKFIDILDARRGFSKINELALPFKIGSQKFKATLDILNGLLIGTIDGYILQWPSDMVEFGGLVSREEQQPQSERIPVILEVDQRRSRVNIVKSNPANPQLIATSFSPDKFDSECEVLSGISLVEL